MEQLEIEQTEHEAQTATAEENSGEGKREFSFKKFKDVESLQKAYSSLESEFTKRSQRLKQLEGERQSLIKELEAKQSLKSNEGQLSGTCAEEFFKQHPGARSSLKQLVMDVSQMQAENRAGGFADAYIELLEKRLADFDSKLSSEQFLLSQIEGTAIKDKIIMDYLQDIKNIRQTAVLLGAGGEITLAPPKRPKTLQEAGAMAREIFQNK